MTKEQSDQESITQQSIKADLLRLGVKNDITLTVHSSLSSIGWVTGGAPTVVRALFDVIGQKGTLAMPSASPQCSNSAAWMEPISSQQRFNELGEYPPLFDPKTTTTEMGAIAETFRNWPDTLRSNHPGESVCANGPHALEITKDHSLAFSEGPGTPFHKLHQQDSWVLLLGVGFNRCTALHFAESLVENRRTTTVRFPIMKDSHRVLLEVQNMADDNDTHFPVIGENFVASGHAQLGSIGHADCSLFRMQELVAFAQTYFASVL